MTLASDWLLVVGAFAKAAQKIVEMLQGYVNIQLVQTFGGQVTGQTRTNQRAFQLLMHFLMRQMNEFIDKVCWGTEKSMT